MGISIGGGIGPFRASAGASNSEIGGCLAHVIVWTLVMVVAIALSSPVLILLGLWLLAQTVIGRMRPVAAGVGIALLGCGVVLGLWLWPRFYVPMIWEREVPTALVGSTVSSGLKRIEGTSFEVAPMAWPEGDQASLALTCRIATVQPAEGARADTREPLNLTLTC